MAALVLWGCALVLPDEDTFTIPASWRRLLHPRRGGVPGPALKVDREASWRLVAEIRSEVDDMLRTMEGEPDVLREATAYLAGAEASPRGAGVAASVVRRILTTGEAWKRAGELAAFVDTWVADHGLVFAVRAVVENERTGIGWKGDPRRPQYYLSYLKASPDVHGHGQAGPLVTRLRAHLAVAGDTDHQAAVEALAERRADCHPLVAAFLFPGQADWVAEARAVASGRPPILLCALDSVDALRANRNDAGAAARDSSTLPTLAEATGPAIAPFLAGWFDTEGLTAGELRRLVNTLAALPTDEAFELLLARLDRKYVHAAVLDAAQRFPVRATRLLARSGHDDLLRAHVLGNRELLTEASLPDDVRAEVDRIAPPAPDEDAGSLPEWLMLPTRIPPLPAWVGPGLLPPVILRDGGEALPATAAGHVVTMLAMSRPGTVYAGVDAVKELCTAASLAEFGWGLFERWQKVGMPAKDGWALDALGWLGDDETVRRLTPLIRAWPGEGGHARAVHALDVLAEIGTEVALMHLHGIAQKTKTRALRVRAREKIAAVAATLSLTPDQLGDRLVPHLGLDENGSLTLDYGPRQFVVGFDEGLRPYVLAAGVPRKDLPKPGAADDPELAAAARARFAALKKDVRTLAGDQVRRFEQAMVTGRRWTAAEFEELFVAHPLLRHVVRRLVWADFNGGVTAFRVAEDDTLADGADAVFKLPPSASVGIPHPLDLADTWAELFADYEIVQPFPQLGRPVHTLADGEDLTRFEGVTVPTGRILGLTRRGWQRAAPQDNGVEPWLTRALPGNMAVVLNLDPGITAGYVDEFPTQRIEHVWLSADGEGDWAPRPGPPFGDLGRVSVSEVLADLVELTG